MNVLSPAHPSSLGERDAATFFRECFIDELARAAWRDPVQYRREMLADSSRLRGVLDEAARVAGWSRPLPDGHARGVALSVSRGVLAAHVAEVTQGDDGVSRVHRVLAGDRLRGWYADPGAGRCSHGQRPVGSEGPAQPARSAGMTAPRPFSFATMMVLAQRRHAARVVAQESLAPQPQRKDTAVRSPIQDLGSFLQRIAMPNGKHV